MKKGLFLAGICLLAAGVGMSWIGRAMGGATQAEVRIFGQSIQVFCGPKMWSVDSGWESDWERSSVELDELDAFDTIDIDVDLGDITIQAGDRYGLELDWWGSGYELAYANEAGKLEIWSREVGFGGLSADGWGGEITVTVPYDQLLKELTVDSDLGDITITQVDVETADMTLDLGSLSGDELSVSRSLTVDADLGEVALSGNLTGETVITADLGSVLLMLDAPKDRYSYDLQVDLGDISVDGTKFQETVTGGNGENYIEVEASLGDITIQFSGEN